MFSLFIRNLIYTILQPGLVAGLIPFWLIGFNTEKIFMTWKAQQYVACVLFLLGFILMCWCIINFAVQGKGTLSPADRTQNLVISGPYKISRNPMYIGVMGMLIGEAVFFGATRLWLYSGAVFLAFNVFILMIEEPRLHRDFGATYLEYCQQVRRWL